MCPFTHFKILSMAVAVVAAFVFGALWYGPLFGKTWAQLAGFKMDKESCNGKPPVAALLLTLLGTMSTVFVLAYVMGNGLFSSNVSAAYMVWIGFYVPLMLGSVTWERRPWKFFLINASYAFISLQLTAAILTYLK